MLECGSKAAEGDNLQNDLHRIHITFWIELEQWMKDGSITMIQRQKSNQKSGNVGGLLDQRNSNFRNLQERWSHLFFGTTMV